MDATKLREQFEKFCKSHPVRAAIDTATMVYNRSKKRLQLEVSETGYRVIPALSEYQSPHVCVFIPFLFGDQWDDEEPRLRFYDLAMARFQQEFENAIKEIQ